MPISFTQYAINVASVKYSFTVKSYKMFKIELCYTFLSTIISALDFFFISKTKTLALCTVFALILGFIQVRNAIYMKYFVFIKHQSCGRKKSGS